jgi:hypothetical protein
MFVDCAIPMVVLACTYHSKPIKELQGGFSSGRLHEKGAISWTRRHAGSYKNPNRHRGGAGTVPSEWTHYDRATEGGEERVGGM